MRESKQTFYHFGTYTIYVNMIFFRSLSVFTIFSPDNHSIYYGIAKAFRTKHRAHIQGSVAPEAALWHNLLRAKHIHLSCATRLFFLLQTAIPKESVTMEAITFWTLTVKYLAKQWNSLQKIPMNKYTRQSESIWLFTHGNITIHCLPLHAAISLYVPCLITFPAAATCGENRKEHILSSLYMPLLIIQFSVCVEY